MIYMVQFFLRCSAKALSIHRKWLLAALIPVMIYLGIAATIPDRFVVTQDISVTADTLISLSPRATDLRSLKELISEPNIFFQNRFALALLAKRLEMRLPATESRGTGMSLIDKVDQCLTLDMTEGNIVQVAYMGDHRNEGEAMVAFYSERLIRQAEDYLALKPIGGQKRCCYPPQDRQGNRFGKAVIVVRFTFGAGVADFRNHPGGFDMFDYVA